MKSYTDIEQSKKLAEILPTESADMWWREVSYGFYHIESEIPKGWYNVPPKGIPCWSLTALLNAIPQDRILLNRFEGKWYASAFYWDESENAKEIEVEEQDTPIEACYKLILKLHELKLL